MRSKALFRRYATKSQENACAKLVLVEVIVTNALQVPLDIFHIVKVGFCNIVNAQLFYNTNGINTLPYVL